MGQRGVPSVYEGVVVIKFLLIFTLFIESLEDVSWMYWRFETWLKRSKVAIHYTDWLRS